MKHRAYVVGEISHNRAGTVLWLWFCERAYRECREFSRLEGEKKKYLAWHPPLCVHVRGLCTGLEWNYLLVIHVEWRTNGFDVKNERAFLLFPRRVTVVFLTGVTWYLSRLDLCLRKLSVFISIFFLNSRIPLLKYSLEIFLLHLY